MWYYTIQVLQLVKKMTKNESAMQKDGANNNASAIVHNNEVEERLSRGQELAMGARKWVLNGVAAITMMAGLAKAKITKGANKDADPACAEAPVPVLASEADTEGNITLAEAEALLAEEESNLKSGSVDNTDLQNGTVETNGAKEIIYNPTEHDKSSLTPEKREAIEKKRVMHIVIVTTEEAKAEVEGLEGDFKAGTQKIAQATQDFFANAGADIQFDVQCDDITVDVIVVPRSEYADEEGQTSKTAETYMNTNLNTGSYLDNEFTALANRKGIPRDKLAPFMYIKNATAGALTNYGSPGIVLSANSNLNPKASYDKFQQEVGPHEFVKKLIGEHPNEDPGSLNHSVRWEIPTDNDGKLLYDFRENTSDPLPVNAIHSAGFPHKGGERLIPNIPDKDMKISLYDHKSGEYITLDFGSETADPWHHGYWENLDDYTHERVADTQAPELLTENGLWPQGKLEENDTRFDLKMNFNEDVVAGEGWIYLYGTYKGPDGTENGVRNYEFPASDLVIDGSKVSLPVDIDKFTEYYVNVDEGALKDASGNNFAGINDNSTWVFETKDFATGIDDVENQKFEIKVYPNPFTDYINIDQIENFDQVRVSTISGQEIKIVENSYDQRIDLPGLTAGFYLVTGIKDGKPVVTKKIIKR